MTDEQLTTWLDGLPAERQSEITREGMRRTYHLSEPFLEFWVRDYREIAPGIFFPMTQGTSTRQGTIVDLEINQPLPDDLWYHASLIQPQLWDLHLPAEAAPPRICLVPQPLRHYTYL